MKTSKMSTLVQKSKIASLLVAFLVGSLPYLTFGSTTSVTENRPLSSFDKIEISGAFEVVLVQGSTEELKVEADEENIGKIISKVTGNTLKIYTQGTHCCSGKMGLTISFKNINSIDLAGSISMTSSGPIKADQLEIETSGATKTNMEVSASKLDVEISGSGNTSFIGSATNVEVEISGSGKFLAPELTASNYEIEISGSGNAEVMASENLEVSVSGSGKVKYKGDPKIKQEISGSGKLEKM